MKTIDEALNDYGDYLSRYGFTPSITSFELRYGKKIDVSRAERRKAFREYFGIKKRAYKDRTQRDPIVQEALDLRAVETPVDPVPAPAKPLYGGRLESPDEFRKRLDGRVFVFTAAQNNTLVHQGFWEALQNYCMHRGAQLGVAKISYNKNGWQKITKDNAGDGSEVWYSPELEPYFIEEQVKVADDLLFCGELDILPTAVYPLNGLQNYTGHNSAIIPHTKMQMQALATMKGQDAKHLYSTGAVTLRNYIQRRAGQVAEYHHVYGAIVAEIDCDGKWYVRQLNADENGTFYDLDMVYMADGIRPLNDDERIIVNLGDIHKEKLDTVAYSGVRHMMNNLPVSHIIVHDLLDFTHRNHHNIKDPFFWSEQLVKQRSVEQDIADSAAFMTGLAHGYPNAQIVSVRSNHDQAIIQWLKTPIGLDPVNVRYWHELNAAMYTAIERGEKPDPFGVAIWSKIFKLTKKLDINIKLLEEDESLVIHGIEFGMHGHLGPNGARGNPKAFRQIGKRANTGHTHSAGIVDGIYTAGVLANLDMGYNKGPSSWSQSHILTYPNGKRTIITQRGPKWRA